MEDFDAVDATMSRFGGEVCGLLGTTVGLGVLGLSPCCCGGWSWPVGWATPVVDPKREKVAADLPPCCLVLLLGYAK